MDESLMIGLAAAIMMGMITAILWRNSSSRRLARPMMILTALTLMHVVTAYQGNLSDPVIRYTIVYPQRLVGIWAMFEIFRLWRDHRGPAPVTK